MSARRLIPRACPPNVERKFRVVAKTFACHVHAFVVAGRRLACERGWFRRAPGSIHSELFVPRNVSVMRDTPANRTLHVDFPRSPLSPMTPETNSLGQLVGFPVPGWTPPPAPSRRTLTGRYCRLEPLDPARHAAALFAANQLEPTGAMWTYLPYGPFASLASYRAWMDQHWCGDDPLFFSIIDQSNGEPAGLAAYLRISPAQGTIEVGHLAYSPGLQRTPAATEAMYLMMEYAFQLGYRRYEWKCDHLNAPSRAAAQRLGFSFEGIFRQALVVRGRNRDTAWFSIIDGEWPALRSVLQRWLEPGNFDAAGNQRLRLSDLTRPLLASRG